jgi:uncharacterized membrane protein
MDKKKGDDKKSSGSISENISNIASLGNLSYPKLSFGQRAADILSRSAGSWTFIIGFFVFLIFWMMVNVYAWINTWDPYPFILLNLVLSCLAAIQAPVILMSQNRQAEKDRLKVGYDYKVNRKTEKEVGEIVKQLNRIEKKLNK